MLDLRATGEDVNRQDTVYVRVAAILIVRINRLCLQRGFFNYQMWVEILISQTLEQTKQIGQFAVLLRKDFSNSPSPPILSCVACYRGVAMQQ